MSAGAPAAASSSDRLAALHRTVLETRPALCAERAVLVTRYFANRDNRHKPMVRQKAEALASVLCNKRARIYPRELLVGCFTAHRVGGGVLPELHGVAMLEDLLAFDRRQVNPLQVSRRDRRQLLIEVLPFWASRFLALQIRPRRRALRFIATQLDGSRYVVNEAGGISHVVPNYRALLERGTDGFRRDVARRLESVAAGSPEADFLEGVRTVCDGLDGFADGYRREALQQAAAETDGARRQELRRIAATCARVPREPARTLQEALQALLFAQIAINLESLDNSVCPGRLDQILYPHYRHDRDAGALTDEAALELLGCFAIKLCEIVPVFSRRLTAIHGGMFNGQVVVVGGTDREGRDCTNELTSLWLRLMAELRTRQPNYHARLHRGSPPHYRRAIAQALAGASASPALYNDEVIRPILEGRGIEPQDAADYATVGCVEPVAAGKSFLSTDAALVNVPSCLEQALYCGRRAGRRRRIGVATPPAARCRSMDELVALFQTQLDHTLGLVLDDLRLIEQANARHHPTPLTSMLLDGCLEQARDASSGGARYNGSGVQCVGAVDAGDSLAAIEHVVFERGEAALFSGENAVGELVPGEQLPICGAPPEDRIYRPNCEELLRLR
ncbi:MAG: pyruvate formate lyase family protein, partial [Deltaproteobacteria bacterium]|nr:pyruvate formate lyase family protein [Deltaproteobacteria bacterium]MBW2537607.1 pyruvate formate lyase family protein [Deltaproteobacteria bacterium]